MQKIRPQAVIFDLGSTLIEYEARPWDQQSKLCLDQTHRHLTQNQHPVPSLEQWHISYYQIRAKKRAESEATLREWLVPDALSELTRIHGLGLDDRESQQLFEQFYQTVANELFVYEETIEVLSDLRANVSAIGLISNTIFPEEVHRGELSRFGIEKYFDFAIFSSSFGFKKPHPNIFHEASRLAGFAPSECVYIGDRYREDILGPTSIGMHAILRHTQNREYPDPLPSDLRVIKTLRDLGNHLHF